MRMRARRVCWLMPGSKGSGLVGDGGRTSGPDGKNAVISMVNQFNPSVVVIEDKSTGQSLLQELPGTAGAAFLPFEPDADKITRLGVESPVIEEGRVMLPENATWLNEYEREMASFPNSEYMDQADVTSMALRWLRERFNVIESGLPERGVRDPEMSGVNRIEAASEDPDSHRGGPGKSRVARKR